MNSWQRNPISYEIKRLINFVLRWRFRCIGLNRFLPQKDGNFRCAWIVPDKGQLNGPMLIGRGQKSHWSAKSIRWHLLNVSFSIYHSNIMSDNSSRKLGLRQPVPEAQSPKNLPKSRLLQKKKFTGWHTWPPTSVWNFRSVYPMLRLKPPPRVSLIWTALWTSWRDRFMVSHRMSRCSSRWNSPTAWLSLRVGGRQLAIRSSGKPSNSM